jgi:hypothetical protein
MTLHYKMLSRQQRKAAAKLAKRLLRTVPAGDESMSEPGTLRGALTTRWYKPEHVIAVLIYSDRDGHWFGDVVLGEDGLTHQQIGTSQREPAHSHDEALEHVKHIIAMIKGAKEHPVVQRCRDLGIDPGTIGCLRIYHSEEGYRWILMHVAQGTQAALDFLNAHLLPEGMVPLQSDREADEYCKENVGLEALEVARKVIFDHIAELPIDPEQHGFLNYYRLGKGVIPDPNYWPAPAFQAAAFLLRNGVPEIDDRDQETDTSHIRRPIVPDSPSKLSLEQLLAPPTKQPIGKVVVRIQVSGGTREQLVSFPDEGSARAFARVMQRNGGSLPQDELEELVNKCGGWWSGGLSEEAAARTPWHDPNELAAGKDN